uniref:Uncharacterized protein n=1 Tax=Anguilla anguilla TaxID=7936 RepID=A0A0E9TNA4_ANGAN
MVFHLCESPGDS